MTGFIDILAAVPDEPHVVTASMMDVYREEQLHDETTVMRDTRASQLGGAGVPAGVVCAGVVTAGVVAAGVVCAGVVTAGVVSPDWQR